MCLQSRLAESRFTGVSLRALGEVVPGPGATGERGEGGEGGEGGEDSVERRADAPKGAICQATLSGAGRLFHGTYLQPFWAKSLAVSRRNGVNNTGLAV